MESDLFSEAEAKAISYKKKSQAKGIKCIESNVE
jgi:hypothetical protein